ncbi:MAG: HTH-type transcriptional regulator PerR [Herbaspirillum frisingense]|uniref:HTH-type transcriptional regulator PerR n=1 Tax=Herbaspirillum frisingense TaxID=92645 RepID=A0A7V8G030_9BURK|nr:MAG: HTH-type transcriptional regulator PerR [Herbaspirillum frisingense]
MRKLPSFFSLRAFEAAARLGSFTLAADELHLTTSAISHQVRALEEWCGKDLFIRQTRRVTLTMEGQLLLNKLSPAFDAIEDACAVFRQADERAVLAVHCAPSFASKWLSPRLGQFMQAHPAITLQMSSSAEPIDLQRDSGIDIDITYGAPPHREGVIVEALGTEPTLPLCSPALLQRHAVRGPLDLLELTLIESKLNPVRWKDWFDLHGVRLPARAHPSFDRGSLAVAAAVDGLGVALETARFAEAELARGDLVIVGNGEFRTIEQEMHFLCYRRGDAGMRGIKAFREWVRGVTGDAPAAAGTA